MKKLFILMMSVVVSSVVYAAGSDEGVKWEKGTFAEALAKASDSNKYLFVDCYATWCGPCKRMANDEFTKKAAGDYFNNNFVNIAIDMEKGEGVEIAKEYQIRQYPTFLIFSPEGKLVARIVGGAEINEFIGRVKSVMADQK